MRRSRVIPALIGVLVATAAWVGVPAAQAEDTPVAERAYQEIQDCVSRPDAQLNVLYVVDESGSLSTTDPDAVRAAVLAQSLNQLGAISVNRAVYSSVAMFAEGFRVERPWTELNPETARQEANWARSSVGDLNLGSATNWLAALQGAAQSMEQSPDADAACKVVVWMTDGGIVMPDGGLDEVGALTEICGTDPFNSDLVNGISPAVAQLRTSGINLIGVLLRAGSNTPEELSIMTYMRPIVEGEGLVDLKGLGPDAPPSFDYSCGQVPIPEDQAAGALIEADDPLDLAFKFAAISIRIAGGSQGAVDPGPPATFQIDPGVGYFYVLIEGSDWSLTGPDGSVAVTESTETSDIAVVAAGGLRTVEVRGESVREGTWTVKDADGDIQLFLYSGLEMTLAPEERYLNEESALTFTLTRNGSPIQDLSAYQPSALTVSVSEPGGSRQELTCTPVATAASFTCPYTPEQVGEVTVIARLPLTTVGGIELQPVPFEDRVRVQPTPDYPQVQEPAGETGLHEFSPLVGRRGSAQGTFTLLGPAKGSGEICFPSDVTITIDPQPDRIPDYSYRGLPTSCVPLAEGETASVTMTVTNPVSATGTVEGFLAVTLKSGERSATATQEVAFTFASDRKADPPPLVLAALGILALALPIGLLYLQSARAARLDLR